MRRFFVFLTILVVAAAVVYYGYDIYSKRQVKTAIVEAKAFRAIALAWQVKAVKSGPDGLVVCMAPLIEHGRGKVKGNGLTVSFPCLRPADRPYWLEIKPGHTHWMRYQKIVASDTVAFLFSPLESTYTFLKSYVSLPVLS